MHVYDEIVHLYSSLKAIILNLKRTVPENRFDMNIRRGHVLNDALKRLSKPSFLPSQKIMVSISLHTLN